MADQGQAPDGSSMSAELKAVKDLELRVQTLNREEARGARAPSHVGGWLHYALISDAYAGPAASILSRHARAQASAR